MLDEQTQIERALLISQLEVLRKILEPGLSVINWHSLTMQDFIGSVRKVRGPSVQHVLQDGFHLPEQCI